MFDDKSLTDQTATFTSENGLRDYGKSPVKGLSKRISSRWIVVLLALAMLVPMVGCRSYQFAVGDAVMLSYRDMVWARRAYNLRYGNLDRPYGEHFYNGFCAGYADVMNGGDGYVPALPPVTYRGPRFQSTDGLQCVNAWFEGFPAGVKAAKQEKVGDLNQVPISKMMEAAIQMEKNSKDTPRAVTKVERDPKTNVRQNPQGVPQQDPFDLQSPAMPTLGDFSSTSPNQGGPVQTSPVQYWPNPQLKNPTIDLSRIPADFGYTTYPVTNAVGKEVDTQTNPVQTNPVQTNPVQVNPVQVNPVQVKSVPSKLPPIVSPSEVIREAKEFSVVDEVSPGQSPSQSSRRLR